MTEPQAIFGTDSRPCDLGALVRGNAMFTSDVPLADPLIVHFVRSPVACADFSPPDIDDALLVIGVHAVHLGAELAGLGALGVNPVLPMMRAPKFPLLATGRVQAIGQPVAAILASSEVAGADRLCVMG